MISIVYAITVAAATISHQATIDDSTAIRDLAKEIIEAQFACDENAILARSLPLDESAAAIFHAECEANRLFGEVKRAAKVKFPMSNDSFLRMDIDDREIILLMIDRLILLINDDVAVLRRKGSDLPWIFRKRNGEWKHDLILSRVQDDSLAYLQSYAAECVRVKENIVAGKYSTVEAVSNDVSARFRKLDKLERRRKTGQQN
jgi:hypothetical protein